MGLHLQVKGHKFPINGEYYHAWVTLTSRSLLGNADHQKNVGIRELGASEL